MLAVSQQVLNFRDEELRQHLKNELSKIAKLLSEKTSQGSYSSLSEKNSNELKETGLILLESILNVSLPAQDPVSEFLTLLTQIIEVRYMIIPTYEPVIRRFCEELPLSQAGIFWPLLVRLRAE